MKLNHIFSAILALAVSGAFTSCEDMMDLKSDSHVTADDNRLDSANDSLYSAMGILTQIQNLGERYVLLGELRGDLMNTTPEASVSLQEISSFNTTADNVYSFRRDYFSIINNCNYAIARMDTTVTEHLNRVMVPEYVAIKTMRAWTYLQMGLAYGSVEYIEKPILSLEESEAKYPKIGLDELVDRLIADLEPHTGVRTPDYGSVDGRESRRFFMEPRLLLADLYLYRGDYAMAAQNYYDYIRDHSLRVEALSNTWATSQALETGNVDFMTTYEQESLVEIPYSSETRRQHPNLINLTYAEHPAVVPAEWWVSAQSSASHFHIDREGASAVSGFLEGDLRGRFSSAAGTVETEIPVSFGRVETDASLGNKSMLVTKFFNSAKIDNTLSNPENILMDGHYTTFVALERIPHVYLRYAEAVNRLGKPTLAFAVLKYGLRGEVLADATKVDPDELASGETYTNFSSQDFDLNRGTASRGRGLGISLSQSTYGIPAEIKDDPQAVMVYVEDAIVEELAAETQFEGNRFFDLVRVSRHRGTDEYFADMVSRRFDNPVQAKARLADRSNWWLK